MQEIQKSKDAPSVNKVSDFLNEVQQELKKAIWPTREELIRMTQVVLFLIAIIACYCGLWDWILSKVTMWLFLRK